MATWLGSKVLNLLSVAINYGHILSNLTDNLGNLDDSVGKFFQNKDIWGIGVKHDPKERYMNCSELIRSYGYVAEEYTVESGSGYLLTMMRIPRAGSSGSPVLLVHGLAGSCDVYLTSGKKSLAFLLADASYDVWLLNVRGNVYSKKHIYLSSNDPAFWKFSFHQIGTEDLPAAVDFILRKTQQTKLAYVGHSQGTTSAYIMLALNSTYNEKLSVMISLAPEGWTSQMFSPIPHLLAKFRKAIQKALEALGIYQFLPVTALSDIITKDIFGSSPLLSAIFETVWFLVWGFNFKQIDLQNVQNQIGHFSGGSSMYQVYHYLQGIQSGDFKQYDFGKAKNVEVYGVSVPPAYPVDRITCKMFFFYSHNDWLSNYADQQKLTARVQNVMGEYNVVGFNHINYCWARDAGDACYYQLIKVIQTANQT